jgi:pimeloyl-ACP methyl ester carboxylesterase
MFEGFQPFTITTQSNPKVDIYGLESGKSSSNLPGLLLVHGYPQNYRIWHRVAPQLTEQYTVVVLDIRGYGQSSKPEPVSEYAKSTMARDCVTVMEKLGFDSFYICAHDRGARVAHKLAVDYPDRVRKAIFLDICPTLAMYTSTNFDFAKAYFHWFFLIQKEPLPETLIAGNPRELTEMFMGGRQESGLQLFDHDCFESYVKGMEDPATVHTMCQDYRASATLDLEEAREDLKQGRLIKSPLRVIWGKYGVIEKCFDAVKEWQAVTEKGVLVDGYAVESGHYIPEQAPDDVVAAIREFLV